MKGLIAQIQRFSTKDGPGIRTTVFLKGCNLRCLWCHNPEMMSPRPILKYNPVRCTHCGACVAVCPKDAVAMDKGRRVYERSRCEACGTCVEHCLQDALELVGTEYTPKAMTGLLLRDADYYRESGGGVTFSGGEPLLQAPFLLETLRLLKAQGIHTALDTAFHIPWETIETVLPYVDLVLLDIKGMDRFRHREHTGVDPFLIWDNGRRLSLTQTRVIVRMPLIDTLNAELTGIETAAALMKNWKNLLHVELLPYHNLGVEKSTLYPDLDAQAEFSRPPAILFVRAEEVFSKYGIAVLY